MALGKEGTLAIVVAVLVAAFYTGFFQAVGLFSVINIEPGIHNVSSLGHNWSIDAPWGETGYRCRYVNQAHQTLYMEDNSADNSIDIFGSLPRSGSGDCGTYGASVTVQMTDLDLRTVSKVVIRRSASVEASGKDRNSGTSSDVMGLLFTETNYDTSANWGSVNRNYGDIVILNEGGAITVISDEGRKVIIPSGPLYFTNAVSVHSNNVEQGSLRYVISAVEITPFCPSGAQGQYPGCVCQSGSSYNVTSNTCSVIVVPVQNTTTVVNQTNTTVVVNQTTQTTVNSTTNPAAAHCLNSGGVFNLTSQLCSFPSVTTSPTGSQSVSPIDEQGNSETYIWLIAGVIVVIAVLNGKNKKR